MNVLGIDGGASSSKWVVLGGSGWPVAEGRAGPITGHVFSEAARAQVAAELGRILLETAPYSPAAIVAGITGLDAGTPESEWFAKRLEEGSRLPPDRVRVFNDMDLAYRAHFAPGEGILVYAGTGSVAYHIARDGSVVRAGGHGYLIGDEGGGFWIGKTALRQLLRWQDSGVDLQEYPLAQQLHRAIGGGDWPRIRGYVYSGGRQAVAALAPAVGEAAASGDAAAQGILALAGRELAALALTLRSRLGDLPVLLTGGALKVSPLIEASAKERLEVGVSHLPFAQTAARIALKELHE
jgi:N-acetylglucosamine kinase-like BadF-type ATPase